MITRTHETNGTGTVAGRLSGVRLQSPGARNLTTYAHDHSPDRRRANVVNTCEAFAADPIGPRGSLNIYSAVGNDLNDQVNYLGRHPHTNRESHSKPNEFPRHPSEEPTWPGGICHFLSNDLENQ